MLKWVTLVFVAWMLLRIFHRLRRHELGRGEAGGWVGLWLVVLAAAWFPHGTDVVAQWFGVGRGADLLIFISIVALFALVSWLLTRVEKIEREITIVVRETALRDVKEAGGRERGGVNGGRKISNF
ncbi:MAG: DUF2304 domain-containing protein [Patescibacteria group bacterium]|nr:DUF2304 domain-containing protein [Patescibacteria group bacterium]